MTVILAPMPPAAKGKRLVTRKVQAEDGTTVTVREVDIHSPTLRDDLLRSYRASVRAIRQEHVRRFGSPEGPVAIAAE